MSDGGTKAGTSARGDALALEPHGGSPDATRAFRLDIGGLRAIAVVLVVLFHFAVPVATGGFVGVDVFFVISGFLMTQIIREAMLARRFSYGRFLWARCCRIVPALLVMAVTVVAVAWWLIEPMTYAALAQSAAGSIAFVSNLLYMKQAGYFAGSADQNWFLHTWSLSVEWQFYMVYPLLVLVLVRAWGGRYFGIGLLLCTIVSLALCVFMTDLRPVYAFYLLPFRAWELMAGGLVQHYAGSGRPVRRSNLLELAGLGLIGLSALSFGPYMPWPSFLAVLPVLGTVFVLAAGRGERSALRAAPIQALGRWSYSIYLWHWPIVVALHYFELPFGPAVIVGGSLASLALGWLSYAWVEQRSQQLLRTLRSTVARWATLVLPAGAAVGSMAIVWTGGVIARAPQAATELADAIDARRAWDFPPGRTCQGIMPSNAIQTCAVGRSTGGRALVIGDSEAQQWYPRYAALAATGLAGSITFATLNGCSPVRNVERREPGHDCAAFALRAHDLAMKGRWDRVVYIAAWPGYFGDPADGNAIGICRAGTRCFSVGDGGDRLALLTGNFPQQVRELVGQGKAVAVVLPLPTPGYDLPGQLAKRLFAGAPRDDLRSQAAPEVLARTQPARSALIASLRGTGATLFDPVPAMCPAGTCPMIDSEGRSLYKDSVHLRPRTVRDRLDVLDPVVLPRANRNVGQGEER